MSRHDSETDTPRGILPYIAAFVLLVVILVLAWYLWGRSEHVVSFLWWCGGM